MKKTCVCACASRSRHGLSIYMGDEGSADAREAHPLASIFELRGPRPACAFVSGFDPGTLCGPCSGRPRLRGSGAASGQNRAAAAAASKLAHLHVRVEVAEHPGASTEPLRPADGPDHPRADEGSRAAEGPEEPAPAEVRVRVVPPLVQVRAAVSVRGAMGNERNAQFNATRRNFDAKRVRYPRVRVVSAACPGQGRWLGEKGSVTRRNSDAKRVRHCG